MRTCNLVYETGDYNEIIEFICVQSDKREGRSSIIHFVRYKLICLRVTKIKANLF